MNTTSTRAFAAYSPTEPLKAFEFQRRSLQDTDVHIEIKYCGVCHSDIHTVRGEWGPRDYPLVPGHEIVGVVTALGSAVKGFKLGQAVGVGCFVDSCLACAPCKAHQQQHCEKGATFTYGSTDKFGKVTQGGYSSQIVVDEKFVLRIPESLPLAAAAPLLCAGITTYSPMKTWNVRAGQKVAILGLGGLGHMGVKFAKAFGAEVTVLSSSANKEQDALRLGADHFVNTRDPKNLKNLKAQFDFILNTVSANHDVNEYMQLLNFQGKMVLVGLPSEPTVVPAGTFIGLQRSLSGSLIGGIQETQEMLDFCAKHKIVSDIELIPMQKINEAYERTVKADVKYRFVIDMASL